MDLDDYLDHQANQSRDSKLAQYFKISEDQLDLIFEGDIRQEFMNDDHPNGHTVYLIDNAPKEITSKISAYEANGNYVWVPDNVFIDPDNEF